MGLLLERWNGAWGQEKQSSLALPWLYLALRAQPFRAFLSRGEHEGGACAHSPLERAQPREAILEPMSDAREHSGGWILVLRGRARGLMQVEESGCTRLWSFPKDYSCPDWGLVLADTSLRRKEPERSQPLLNPSCSKPLLGPCLPLCHRQVPCPPQPQFPLLQQELGQQKLSVPAGSDV